MHTNKKTKDMQVLKKKLITIGDEVGISTSIEFDLENKICTCKYINLRPGSSSSEIIAVTYYNSLITRNNNFGKCYKVIGNIDINIVAI